MLGCASGRRWLPNCRVIVSPGRAVYVTENTGLPSSRHLGTCLPAFGPKPRVGRSVGSEREGGSDEAEQVTSHLKWEWTGPGYKASMEESTVEGDESLASLQFPLGWT